ncbi:MAG: hypothetical protein ACRDIE_02355 [Chloroflexota bacterium]
MAALTFFEAQQEAERISRALPEMSRKAASMREHQERADKLKADLIDIAGQIIQTSDRLIAEIRALPPEKAAEHAALLEQLETGRKLAFARMGQYNPEQLWFWTEEWQAGEREADREIAAGEVTPPMTGDEFLAELDALIARKE